MLRSKSIVLSLLVTVLSVFPHILADHTFEVIPKSLIKKRVGVGGGGGRSTEQSKGNVTLWSFFLVVVNWCTVQILENMLPKLSVKPTDRTHARTCTNTNTTTHDTHPQSHLYIKAHSMTQPESHLFSMTQPRLYNMKHSMTNHTCTT